MKEKEDHIREEKTTRLVRHDFSDEEKLAMAQVMSNATVESGSTEEELSVIKKQFAGRLAEAEGIIVSCAEKIRSGFEMRREPCTVTKDYKANTVTVTRDATGEVVEERTMTADEMQMPLLEGQEAGSED